MEGVGFIFCDGLLDVETCVCVLVHGAGSHLSEGQLSI